MQQGGPRRHRSTAFSAKRSAKLRLSHRQQAAYAAEVDAANIARAVAEVRGVYLSQRPSGTWIR
jgi:hypothetical protein